MVPTVLNRADQVSTSTEGVVNDEGNTAGVADLGDLLKIRNVVAGVSDGLNVDSLGLLIDGGGNVLRLVTSNETGLDSHPREHDLELVVGTAIEVGGGNDVVAGVCKGGDGHFDRVRISDEAAGSVRRDGMTY